MVGSLLVWSTVALLGLAAGSFLNVCIDRPHAGQSILGPRSRCFACGATLAARDLIPVVSYLVLRGRCRFCSAQIPRRMLAVEAGTALLFLLLWSQQGASAQFAFTALVACVFVIVLVVDLECGLIPNAVMLPAIGAALAVSPFTIGPGLPQAVWGGVTGLALFSLIILLYPRAMGLGDVKLAVFVGLVAGFPSILVALFVSFVLGGAVGALAMASGRRGMKDAVPFAPFLTTAGLIAMLYGEEILRWYPALAVG